MTHWTARAARLADQLADAGALRDPRWRAAVTAVPRHELVPRFYELGAAGWSLVDGDDPAQRDRWWEAVYSDTTLVTALAEVRLPAPGGGGSHQVAISSSTLPSLVVEMLEALQVGDRHSVLEVGTGSGYNAALLCALLGDERVASVELRADLVAAARRRLAGIGFRPRLAAADGAAGCEQLAPYDRIVATCATRYVPARWIEQLTPGGMMLVDIEGSTTAGNLARLWRPGDELVVEGRFRRRRATFMPMTHRLGVGVGGPTPVDHAGGRQRWSEVGPSVLHQREAVGSFLAQLHLPAGTTLGWAADDMTRLVGPDGSVALVAERAGGEGRHQVVEAGPVRLWSRVEQATELWQRLGRPAWHRFGITASPEAQYVWFDQPDGRYRWPLDLTGEP